MFDWAAVRACVFDLVDKDAEVFGKDFQRPIGNATLVAIFANRFAIRIQHRNAL